MKSLSLFVVLLLSIPVIGQDFLGENVEGYKGKKLVLKKPTEEIERDGLEGFYKYPKKTRYDKPEVVFPASKIFSTRSSYSNLAKKIFIIDSIQLIHGTMYDYNFKLSNPETGSFYFHYNAVSNKNLFPFKIIVGDSIPAEQEQTAECEFIIVEKDKFTGDKKYDYSNDIFTIQKIIRKGRAVYYLGLYTIGATASTGEGVMLLFNDNTKIRKPLEKTEVRVNSSAQFEHSAFIQLSIAEMQILSRKKLTDFRLYIFDQSNYETDRLQQAAKCLLKSK